MKKIQTPLTIVNLKIYFRERAYSMPQIEFLTLMNLKKQQEEAIKYFKKFNEKDVNKYKRKALEKEEEITEIIKVLKKRKQQVDKAAQIAAKKYQKVQKHQISLIKDDKKNFKKA